MAWPRVSFAPAVCVCVWRVPTVVRRRPEARGRIGNARTDRQSVVVCSCLCANTRCSPLCALRSPPSLSPSLSLLPRHDKAILVANQRRKWGVRWHTVTGKPDRARRRGYPWDPTILVKDGEHVPNGNLVETIDRTAVADGNLAERVRGTSKTGSRWEPSISRSLSMSLALAFHPHTDPPRASPLAHCRSKRKQRRTRFCSTARSSSRSSPGWTT